MKPTPAAYKLFHDGALTLSRIEANGIKIDEEYLDQAIHYVGEKIKCIDAKMKADPMYQYWRRREGINANLGSGDQLAAVLFQDLKLPCKYWTSGGKTGQRKPSTSEKHLAELNNPFVNIWLERGDLVKLKGTFLEGLQRQVVGGFLHSDFSIHLVKTYRSSSGNKESEGRSDKAFNFKNIPRREAKYAKYIRRCFIPRENRYLVEIDFGQQEWNLSACFWEDPEMIRYASDPTSDVHYDYAAETFLCDRSQVHKDMRGMIKSGFVFATLYGSYYVKTAIYCWRESANLTLKDGTSLRDWLASKGITKLGECDPRKVPVAGTFEYHMKQVEDRFFARFHVMKEKRKKWLELYQKRGGFPLLTGFWVNGVYSNNQLLNTPIQGPGFHCLLWSIIEMDKYIQSNNLRTLLVGEIYDCFLMDASEDELQEVLTTANDIMTQKIREAWKWIIVPMKVEIDCVVPGESWFNKKPWICKNGKWEPK